jgi:y4mF family transcriptional regulator
MSTQAFGEFVRKRRRQLNMNQSDLAMVSRTGIRFISDLENGKPTCELGKALDVLTSLGIDVAFTPRTRA